MLSYLRLKKDTWAYSVLIGMYLIALGMLWYIFWMKLTDGPVVYAYSFPEGLVPLFGGIVALIEIKRKNFSKSALGRSITFISCGLISWGVGIAIWGYYNYGLRIDVPYPSLADLGYGLAPIFWFAGIIFLAKATGIKYRLRTIKGKIFATLIPLLSIGLTFYITFFRFPAEDITTPQGSLKLFLDIFYPLSDIIVPGLAMLIAILSWKKVGNTLGRPLLIILMGFVCMYFADMGFVLTTSLGTFHNGNWVDFFYTTAMFLLSIGTIALVVPTNSQKSPVLPLHCADIYAQFALKIIHEEEKIIGQKAWEMALQVKGVSIDQDGTLNLHGNKNQVLNQLIHQYEQQFGNTIRELAKDAIKSITTLVNTVAIDAMITLNINSAILFICQVSTGNFESVFPFQDEKFQLTRRHPLIYYLLSHKQVITIQSIPQLMEAAHTIAEANDLKEIAEELQKYRAEAVGGLYSDQELIGLLLLGGREHEVNLSEFDLHYLTKLLQKYSAELALVIHYRDTRASLLKNNGG